MVALVRTALAKPLSYVVLAIVIAAAGLLSVARTPVDIFPRIGVPMSIYDEAPMPWTLRLTWDGIAIHRGSEMENGNVSHGCVVAPDPFMGQAFCYYRQGRQGHHHRWYIYRPWRVD